MSKIKEEAIKFLTEAYREGNPWFNHDGSVQEGRKGTVIEVLHDRLLISRELAKNIVNSVKIKFAIKQTLIENILKESFWISAEDWKKERKNIRWSC